MLHFYELVPVFPFILEGIWVTLAFTLTSLGCGLPLGILLAVLKVVPCRFANRFAQFYTAIFRGTPLIVQLGMIHYAVPQLTGYSISAFESGVLAFSLNSAAYSSEIIRAGIQSIDRGQWEAAQVLGLSPVQTFIYVILPQAVRNILPALVNEMVDLLKESALVSTIGEMDLLKRAQIVSAEKFLYFEPLILVASLYFVMVMVIGFFAKLLEKRLSYA